MSSRLPEAQANPKISRNGTAVLRDHSQRNRHACLQAFLHNLFLRSSFPLLAFWSCSLLVSVELKGGLVLGRTSCCKEPGRWLQYRIAVSTALLQGFNHIPADRLLDSSMTFSVKSPMKVSTLKLCWMNDLLISNLYIAYDVRRIRLTSRFFTCFASGESLLITLEVLVVSLRSGFFGADDAPPGLGACIVMTVVC